MDLDPDDIAEVARKMLAQYGTHAVQLMEARARNHLRHDDCEGADFWQRVADAVRRLNGSGSAPSAQVRRG